MTYRLGIDTGGTYTDAVVVDSEQNVLATAKRLTTPQDLCIGIHNALQALPSELLKNFDFVSLSTTLTTNSVVEGRGARVCALLPGYTEKQLKDSGLLELLGKDCVHCLDGGHTATGEQCNPLNLEQIENIISTQKDKVAAFAVSSLFATRNCEHEQAIVDLLAKHTDKPVTTGHELAAQLGAPRRALTAALNARMLPFIHELISSVEAILKQFSISAPLMIVTGDGSLVNVATAKKKPLMTILSGPAASVAGAAALSGYQNALIADMGGTTTDIAIVNDRQAELCEDGARIGDWQPMINAVRVVSVGLGGDSEVRFNGKLFLASRRVVPMSLLVDEHPHLMVRLEQQWDSMPNPRHNRFALRLHATPAMVEQLDKAQRQAWDYLEAGPVEMDALAEYDKTLMRSIARLERAGLVIFSGFTPTDATHALGLSKHWNKDAATIATRIWARQMRYLYGCGNWELGDAIAPARDVIDLVTHELAQRLLEAGLNHRGFLNDAKAQKLTPLLADMLLQNITETGKEPVFGLRFSNDMPLVAVGGPAADFFPAVAKLLGIAYELPKHASTASAIGAVLGSVRQAVSVTVTQPVFGNFIVFYKDKPSQFSTLDEAIDHATHLAMTGAREHAQAAGGKGVQVYTETAADHVDHDIDGELFLSTTITATATGTPI